MEYYRRFDITVTFLESQNPKTLKIPLVQPKYYASLSLVPFTTVGIAGSAVSGSQKTPLGKPLAGLGELSHAWNYPIRFYVEDSKLWLNSMFLLIKLRRRRPFWVDTDVGEVLVPLTELFHKYFREKPDNNNNNININITHDDDENLGAFYRVFKASQSTRYGLHFSYNFSDVFCGNSR